jgi:probable aminopeptidase NPEPL1
VESHLNEEWKGEWAHVDIAGPSFRDGRATGFGVALVLDIAKELAKGA